MDGIRNPVCSRSRVSESVRYMNPGGSSCVFTFITWMEMADTNFNFLTTLAIAIIDKQTQCS